MKKKTTEQWIAEARAVHGDKYDYSKSVYVNARTKITVTCPRHGDFLIGPNHHLRPQGCPVCGDEKCSDSIRMSEQEFVRRAREVHGDKYGYDGLGYTNIDSDVTITCPIHGRVNVNAGWHLKGAECPKCRHEETGDRCRMPQDEFIRRARETHGNRYDYSKAEYVDSKTKVCIICPEHGEFWQMPNNHLHGQGCPKCAGHNRTTDEFIAESRKVHGDKYDYSETEYTGIHNPVTVICPEHGRFTQTAGNHIRGHGCPECNGGTGYNEWKFVRKALKVHNGHYDYSKTEYVNSRSKVTVVCPEHGEFIQEAASHLCGCGCPKCAKQLSRAEETIFDFVNRLCPDAVQRDRRTIAPLELDIFVPSRNVAIEYNGILWHSEHYVTTPLIKKTELCETNGIRLIHVFEDEWLERPEVVKSKLRHLLGCDDTVRVHGRKLSVRSVEKEAGDKFLDKYHIQGSGQATVRLGGFYGDELVAVMYFKRTDSNERWELTRFATHDGYNVVGGAGKLFKAFVRQYDPAMVKSFADRRWSNHIKENVYTKLGFTLAEVLKPDYRYVVGQRRVHKFNFRKRLLLAKHPDILTPDMTEREMTEKLGIYRIYDCGLLRYEWKKPDQ